MNLHNRALLIAAGVGAIVQSILTAIGRLTGVQGQSQLFPDPATVDSDALTGLTTFTLLVCCCGLFIDAGIGALYAYLHKQSTPLEMQDGVAGGALAAGLARIVSGLVGVCAGVLLFFVVGQAPTAGSDVAAVILGEGLIISLFYTCLFFIIGAVLGAVGGAIGTAVLGREKST